MLNPFAGRATPCMGVWSYRAVASAVNCESELTSSRYGDRVTGRLLPRAVFLDVGDDIGVRHEVRTSVDVSDQAVDCVVSDDGFDEFRGLAQYLCDVVEDADVGDSSHQFASAYGTVGGDQFHGSISSSRLIL